MKKIYVLFAALFTGLLISCAQPCVPCEHLETETKTVSLPSCTEAGSGEKICKLCGEVVSTYSIPANGHSFETEIWCDHHKCSVCGALDNAKCGYGKFNDYPYSICGSVVYLSKNIEKWDELFKKATDCGGFLSHVSEIRNDDLTFIFDGASVTKKEDSGMNVINIPTLKLIILLPEGTNIVFIR